MRKDNLYASQFLKYDNCIMNGFYINYAGFCIQYLFRYSGTEKYFYPFLEDKGCSDSLPVLFVTDEYLEKHRDIVTEDSSDAFKEYRLLLFITADALLKHKRLIFHSVVVKWKGFAWVIAAPSGVGKTTQFCLWKDILGDDAKLISGDITLLEFRENEIWAHPTPWCGKERMMAETDGAKVGGVIFLKRGFENQFSLVSKSEIAFLAFISMAATPASEEDIYLLSSLTQDFLLSVPCWRLVNDGTISSAELTISKLSEFIGEAYETIQN